MKPFDWSHDKNMLLIANRGIGFETIVAAIGDGGLIAVHKHPNASKYPNQKLYIVAVNNYVYAVPFVETDEVLFLKTIYPSRKYTKLFIKNKGAEI